jgi:hypothetical protein
VRLIAAPGGLRWRSAGPSVALRTAPMPGPTAGPKRRDSSSAQATLQGALEDIGRKIATYDDDGDPIGETLFNGEPRSFLVIGSLDEFFGEHDALKTEQRIG